MRVSILATALLAAACLGGIKLADDPPLQQTMAGDITGVISPAGKVAEISAVHRSSVKKFKADSFDKTTGKFTFKGLPGDASYDICIKTTDGREIEGIDLNYVDAKMLRLAELRRKDLGLPENRTVDFDTEDAKSILQFMCDLIDGKHDFMEQQRVLYVHGHGRRATVLVELMRTRDYYSQKGGELIWRVELWYFENQFGGWDKAPNQEIVLRRERTKMDKWAQISLEYYPGLSAYINPTGFCKAIEFKIPDKVDASRGRPANTKPEIKTQTHVLGLAKGEELLTSPTVPAGATSKPAGE